MRAVSDITAEIETCEARVAALKRERVIAMIPTDWPELVLAKCARPSPPPTFEHWVRTTPSRLAIGVLRVTLRVDVNDPDQDEGFEGRTMTDPTIIIAALSSSSLAALLRDEPMKADRYEREREGSRVKMPAHLKLARLFPTSTCAKSACERRIKSDGKINALRDRVAKGARPASVSKRARTPPHASPLPLRYEEIRGDRCSLKQTSPSGINSGSLSLSW